VYRDARHGIDLAEYPSVLNWYTELMARPAVKTGLPVGQALISGGEFGSALVKRSFF
jgi:glutathione S-transferase